MLTPPVCSRMYTIMTARLYGITHSNRNFSGTYYWGKNQFNSSFPVALACWMRDKGIPCNYLSLAPDAQVRCGDLSFDLVFNSTLPNEALQFLFETRYEPYEVFTHDDLKPIDLVIKNANQKTGFLRPLEIKLTTLPDNTTSSLADEEYGCELVVRNPTTRYIALSIAQACAHRLPELREILEPACHSIRNWDNIREMADRRQAIFTALEEVFHRFHEYQQPLLLQPVWKTLGKSAARNGPLCVSHAVCMRFPKAGRFISNRFMTA